MKPQLILDAPALLDDFYLNLIAWSVRQVMAVALVTDQDVNFDPSLNDDAILKALVYAVHHGKMDHVKVLFNSQYIRPYFLPYGARLLRPYIDYSCKNFEDASFVEFVIEKQPTKTVEFVLLFGNYLKTCHRTIALFRLYVVASEYFQTSFHDYFVSDSKLFGR